MKDYLSRFASIPDMLELDHLTVSGDVTFGRGVSLKVSSISKSFAEGFIIIIIIITYYLLLITYYLLLSTAWTASY